MKYLPQIKTKLLLTLSKDDCSCLIEITDTISKAGVKYSSGLTFFIPGYSVLTFLSQLQKEGYKILKQDYKIQFNFFDKKRKSISSGTNVIISTDFLENPELNYQQSIEKVCKFFEENSYFEMLGFIENIETNGISPKSTTLDKIYSRKSNDYSTYEKFINLFYPHHINEDDFGKYEVQTLIVPLTIVIPTYNAQKTLDRTLFALDNQTLPKEYFQKIKLVIIDDNSTEPISYNWVKSQLNNISNIRIIRTSENVYPGEGRNLAYVNVERGAVLTMDADIILQHNHLINHLGRMHLYTNLITGSTRENIDDSEQYSLQSLKVNYLHTKPDITKDSRYKATYGADYIGGPGYEFTISPFKDTNYYREFGYGKSLIAGIELSLMVKGHNFCMPIQLIRAANYSARFFGGGGDDDTYLGRKAIPAGAFVVPIVSTGTLHFKHLPRLQKDENDKTEDLKRNVQKRRKKMKKSFLYHIP